MSDEQPERLVELQMPRGKRLLVQPKYVAGLKELDPVEGKPPATMIHLGQRGGYPVLGTYEDVRAQLWPKPAASEGA